MYGLPKKSPRSILDGAVIAYLQSSNFGSSYRRAMQLLTICGNKYCTEAVNKAIAEINVRTTAEFTRGNGMIIIFVLSVSLQQKTIGIIDFTFDLTENQDTWLKFEIDKLDHPSIWKGTPFGALFVAAHDRIVQEMEDEHSFELKHNEFYNEQFTDYLLKEIFPYTPMITHCFFDSCNDFLQEDTQAAVENTFRGIKIDENAKQGPSKIGRYVRMRKDTLKGTQSC